MSAITSIPRWNEASLVVNMLYSDNNLLLQNSLPSPAPIHIVNSVDCRMQITVAVSGRYCWLVEVVPYFVSTKIVTKYILWTRFWKSYVNSQYSAVISDSSATSLHPLSNLLLLLSRCQVIDLRHRRRCSCCWWWWCPSGFGVDISLVLYRSRIVASLSPLPPVWILSSMVMRR